MNEYNATCGLTNLPIQENDEVVLLIVRQKNPKICSFAPTKTNATDLASPVFLPIYGLYDGFGSIKQPVTDELTIEMFKKSLCYYANHTTHITYQNLEQFLQNIKEQTTLHSEFFSDNKFFFVFYHKEAFDLVVSGIKNRKPVFKTDTYENLLYKQLSYHTIKSLHDLENKGYISPNENYIFQSSDDTYFGVPYLETLDALRLHPSFNSMKEDFVQQMTKVLCLLTGLNLLRKGFGCNSGAYRNQYELSLHKKLAEFTIQFYEKELQNRKDECNNKNLTDDIFQETLYWYD